MSYIAMENIKTGQGSSRSRVTAHGGLIRCLVAATVAILRGADNVSIARKAASK